MTGFSRKKITLSALTIIALLNYGLPIFWGYHTHNYQWHDLGHLYAIISGPSFYGSFYSPDWNEDHFNIHFTPFFFPLYLILKALGGSIGVFIALTVAAMALSAVLVYQILRSMELSNTLALAGFFSFVLNPFTNAISLTVHYEVFAILFTFACIYAFLKKFYKIAFIFLLAALTVKEDIWLYLLILMIGAYSIKYRRASLVVVTTSLIYKLIVLSLVYPFLYPNQQDIFLRLWPFGHNLREVSYNLIVSWPQTIPRMFQPSILKLLVCSALGLLVSPLRLLPILPIIFLWANCTEVARSELALYYSFPVIIYAYIVGGVSLENANCSHRLSAKGAMYSLMMIQLLASIVFQIEPATRPSIKEVKNYSYTEKDRAIAKVIKTEIKDESSILTQSTLAPYVPYGKDFILTLDHLKSTDPVYSTFPQLIFFDLNPKAVWFPEEIKLIHALVRKISIDANYSRAVDVNDLLLFRKIDK